MQTCAFVGLEGHAGIFVVHACLLSSVAKAGSNILIGVGTWLRKAECQHTLLSTQDEAWKSRKA